MRISTTPEYSELLQRYEQSQQQNAALQLQLLELQRQLAQLQKMIFGSRQERFVPGSHPSQLILDISAEPVAACSVTDTKKISYTHTKVTVEEKPLAHPGRMKLPGDLRREETLVEPAVDTTDCKKIGEEITEVLEYEPGELYVKQYRRPKYAMPDKDGIVIGQLPSRPLQKAMAGEGLLAQIVIDKYMDHLPLHRQMQRFERAGVKLAYSTLTDWVSGTCRLITPLFEALKAEVLQSSYLHADETPIKVPDKKKEGEAHRGYRFAGNPGSLVIFLPALRGHALPGNRITRFYPNYSDKPSNRYVGYEVFAKREGITLIHCIACPGQMTRGRMPGVCSMMP